LLAAFAEPATIIEPTKAAPMVVAIGFADFLDIMSFS
jgi:hypothetical protein